MDITRLRLQNQLLTSPSTGDPAGVVAALGAVQAQDFGGAKWAIGTRMSGVSNADVDRAFNDGAILRTHLLRPTWHFVTRDDIQWMRRLTAPRVNAQCEFRRRQLELDAPTFARTNAAIELALRDGNELTRGEIDAVFARAGIATKAASGEARLSHILMRAELDGIVCSGAMRGKQQTYALLDERAPHARSLTREESLAELASRYFASRGPATLKDFVWWSGLNMTDARGGIARDAGARARNDRRCHVLVRRAATVGHEASTSRASAAELRRVRGRVR